MHPTGYQYFNPRSREGSDRDRSDITGPMGYFNPRSREGSDVLLLYLIDRRHHISIHAPVKGATVYTPDMWDGLKFQSTLP